MSRKIDALIAEHVMGLSTEFDKPSGMKTSKYQYCKNYSTDIAAAWEVLENFPKFWNINYNDLNTLKNVFVDLGSGNQGYAETAPMAICLAALKAKGIQPDKE